jgi:hypothetical protein
MLSAHITLQSHTAAVTEFTLDGGSQPTITLARGSPSSPTGATPTTRMLFHCHQKILLHPEYCAIYIQSHLFVNLFTVQPRPANTPKPVV